MLGMAEEKDSNFVKNKIIADFGCGPRGTLVQADKAKLRIGIDILADKYADEFRSNLLSHNMIYLKSTENVIPLPGNFVDILFTLNAMDHVKHFKIICKEIIRILKPAGAFIGSFNLEENITVCEPNKLNEDIIKTQLLRYLHLISYRITDTIRDGKCLLSLF